MYTRTHTHTHTHIRIHIQLHTQVQYLIDQKADINNVNKTNSAAILAACMRGHREVAELLIECKAIIDQETTRYVCMYVCICMCACLFVYMCVYVYIHTFINAHTYTPTPAYIHTRPHTYTHIYTQERHGPVSGGMEESNRLRVVVTLSSCQRHKSG
jgi:hypothetical protein